MFKKRLAMGILAGIMACSFIAGCGGDKSPEKKQAAAPPPTETKQAETVLPAPTSVAKNIKIGNNTYKLIPLKNETGLILDDGLTLGNKMVFAHDNLLYAAPNNRKLVQLKLEANKLTVVKELAQKSDSVKTQLSANAKGVYYGKGPNLAYYDEAKDSSSIVLKKQGYPTLITQGNSKNILVWINEQAISKYVLNPDGSIGKELPKVRADYKTRVNENNPDVIRIPSTIMSDYEGIFYLGGTQSDREKAVQGKLGTVGGRVFQYDANGKILRTYGNVPKKTPGYSEVVNDIAITQKYLVVADSDYKTRKLNIYEKSTARYLGSIDYKELQPEEQDFNIAKVNLVSLPENKLIIVAGNKKNKMADVAYLLQL